MVKKCLFNAAKTTVIKDFLKLHKNRLPIKILTEKYKKSKIYIEKYIKI